MTIFARQILINPQAYILASILIIYTGGTIGMKLDPSTGALTPFNFDQIEQEVSELKKFNFQIDTLAYTPIDSSNVEIDTWVQIAHTISENYTKYDGFVVLHGTDTMAYTASALSFMLEGLSKPIVFTGSQIPIGMVRTDGKENLISALEIAAAKLPNGAAQVPEVSVFFENELLRGNRTSKYNAEEFRAFRSNNFPPLAHAGIHISYNDKYILPSGNESLQVHTAFDANVAMLPIFPGMLPAYVHNVLNTPHLRAVVLQTYGSGNAPSFTWFLDAIKATVARGIIVLNITQCHTGQVDMLSYEVGRKLSEAGVVSGGDSTTEAALTKLMHLLGQYTEVDKIKQALLQSLRGEISVQA
ncbi:MAG: asparaginase [Bacteroidales bacterium]